jgi:hypothetical protein
MTQHHYTTNLASVPPLPLTIHEPACPRCGCLDIPSYEEELPICFHCGAVLTPPPPDPIPWLSQWPTSKRSGLAQLFYQAVRSGHTDRAAIVGHVVGAIHRKLEWTRDHETRMWWQQVLNAIADDPQAVQAYAGAVFATEQLPATEKAALKQEKAKAFVLASMVGKPPTDKQLWLLRSKGYTGTPSDRAEASELIDTLLREESQR